MQDRKHTSKKKEGNKTKSRIIDTAFNTLYKKGYAASGQIGILEELGVTKGAMYYHFANKSIMVLETYNRYLGEFVEELWRKPLDSANTPIEAILNQINVYRNMFVDEGHYLDIKHGSPLSNFIVDKGTSDEAIFEYLKETTYELHSIIEKALTQAIALKQTKTQFNAKDEAIFIISSIEGSIIMAKALNNINTLDSGLNILKKHINEL